MKEQEGEWRKRWGEFLRGSGLARTSWNTDTVTGRGGREGAEREWTRGEGWGGRGGGGGVSGSSVETGSSTPVSTTWPLPALRLLNPVITQNTRGLTGSVSQHRFPLGRSGLCGTCVSAQISVSVSSPDPREPPLACLSPSYNWFVGKKKPKPKKMIRTCWHALAYSGSWTFS